MSVDAAFAPLTTIPEGIDRAAARDPEHPALRVPGRGISYGELHRRSNRVANMLVAHGVRRGDRVGLYAHKAIDSLTAMFGIMAAGAAYVPINPDAPPAYVGHIVGDCGITHLVVDRTTDKTARSLGAEAGLELRIGVADRDGAVPAMGWDAVWSYADTPPRVAPAADDLAYIIFTSGSTGRPKGIMHTHRSGLAYGEVAAATYGFVPADRIANHAPLNFDLSLLELWGGVVAGATVVVIPTAHARLPASFSQVLADERVSVVNAVPYALVQLLHRGALGERDLSALRWVVFGGEVFPTKDLRALMERLPQARFANVYGPAEVNGVTYAIVPELPAGSNEPISIGAPYPGVEAQVVDAENRRVPPGTTGELLIHSPTHMVGYWRQPELTARSTLFESGPADGGKRWHRTGDLVQEREDGTFQLVGRKDRMVKTRGNRVELDAVETALISHEAVTEAAVYAVPDGEGSKQIEAAVILRQPTGAGDAVADVADLKRHTAQQLPRYAVPRILRIVDFIPRTSTGKADRVSLVTSSQAARNEGAPAAAITSAERA